MIPARYTYYHRQVTEFFKFVIPPGHDVLLVGLDDDVVLDAIAPARGVGVLPENGRLPDSRYERHFGLDMSDIEGTFDYIILKDALAFCQDIGSFLCRLSRFCKPDTRIIVYCVNYLWKPILAVAERLRLKRPGGLENWLSARDITNMMTVAGFQDVSLMRSVLVPLRCFGLGPLLNACGKFLPVFDWLKLNQFQIFRPVPSAPPALDGLTVCLTCRDEKANIEPLVKGIPQLTNRQEILFVEGHSADGTREEIERVARRYPEKNIRLIGQNGTGQGDAIREGFSQAEGDIIILLEADQTSPPENIAYVYQSMRRGHAEFIEGSRFIYPLSRKAMPLLNQVGNWLFAYVFAFLFRQHLTDVLCGIKAIRKADFQKVLSRWNEWGCDDPFGDFELLFGVVRLGLKTAEQPIHYLPRPYGHSKTRAFFHGQVLAKMAFCAFLRFRG